MSKSYLSSKVAVRSSSVHGLGLFVCKPIRQGEIVAIKGGHIYGREVNARISAKLGLSGGQISDQFFIGPLTSREVTKNMLRLNHSCEPNAAVLGSIIFVALRDIKIGEEVSIDYATTYSFPYRMICNCGTRSCRGIVTGNDWKNTTLQKKYRRHFSAYLMEKIGRARKTK